MKHRKLRIAWSVVWGVACLSIVLLWARSYWWWCSVHCSFTNEKSVTVCTEDGETALTYVDFPLLRPNEIVSWWEFQSYLPRSLESRSPMRFTRDRFFMYRSVNGLIVGFPACVLAVGFGVLAATPWIRWSNRFGLRTLLMAMTLVAVVLGLIVWLR